MALLAATATSGLSAPRRGPQPTASLDPRIQALLEVADPDTRIAVIAILRVQADVRAVQARSGERPGAAVVRTLRETATGAQRGLIGQLQAAERAGSAGSITGLWITDAVSFSARPDVIRAIAQRPDVAVVAADGTIQAPLAAKTTAATGGAEPNVALVGAPDLWALGFRGDGTTVAILDTGVDATHPDLAAQYRGGSGAWFDPYGQHATPVDLNGHGTESAGVAVGRSAGGSAIGVAPNASWIAAKIFNDSGTATSTAIHQAFQWVLDPDANPATDDAPDVVNDSWTLGTPGCSLDFEPDLAALVAADITPVFAAGNYGPGTATSPSPANNPDAFSVGAVTLTDSIAASSSRGPTSCGRSTAATYPAVVAPGVNVRSSDLYGTYTTVSGTSIAAPHVSGALALLRQAVPTATGASARAALQATARDLGTAGPDNSFGSGRLDVLAAYQLLAGSGPGPTPTPAPTPTPTPTPTPNPSPTATASPSGGGDTTGPLGTIPAMAPNPANGSSAVAIAATISDATTGGGAVVAAEWFRGAVGAPGTGRAMSGTFGSTTVSVSATIPAWEIATLPDGGQTISVRGRDAAGNWGALATASLSVDRTAPSANGGTLTPAQSQGASTTRLAAQLADAGSGVSGGEWFVGADPGPGLGSPLQPADGAFGAASESAVATVDLGGLPFGEIVISYRARDGAGTWGAVATVAGLVTPSDGTFADGFEAGSTARWSSATGASALTVTSAASMAGRVGLRVGIASGAGGYLTDATPTAATSYHARFGFDARGLVTATKAVDLFVPLTARNAAVLEVQYRTDGGGLGQIRLGAAGSRSTVWTAWASLPTGRHAIEVGWRSATSASVQLWLDGTEVGRLTGVDSHTLTIESVRLGPSAGLAKSMSGELHFDRFVSTAGSTIGP